MLGQCETDVSMVAVAPCRYSCVLFISMGAAQQGTAQQGTAEHSAA